MLFSLTEGYCNQKYLILLQVDHFTRYGMHQYLDDDDNAAKKLKRPPIKPHLQVQ